MSGLNENPEVHSVQAEWRPAAELAAEDDPDIHDAIDSLEVFGQHGLQSALAGRPYTARVPCRKWLSCQLTHKLTPQQVLCHQRSSCQRRLTGAASVAPRADLLRSIKDPEHPHSLEQLKVAQRGLIDVDDARSRIKVNFTPTIPHCSMATLIGLCIRVKLLRSLPARFKARAHGWLGEAGATSRLPIHSTRPPLAALSAAFVEQVDVMITPGKHAQEHDVNKQLNDKERVAAALENDNLRNVVDQCLRGVDDGVSSG